MSVFVRRLSVEEKLDRMRRRYDTQAQRHNAHLVEELGLERKPRLRDQVLAEFPSLTRRWAR